MNFRKPMTVINGNLYNIPCWFVDSPTSSELDCVMLNGSGPSVRNLIIHKKAIMLKYYRKSIKWNNFIGLYIVGKFKNEHNFTLLTTINRKGSTFCGVPWIRFDTMCIMGRIYHYGYSSWALGNLRWIACEHHIDIHH